jgi:hypothetical protein
MQRYARGLGLLIIIGVLAAVALTRELPRALTGPVLKVVDGDTIDVQPRGARGSPR